MPNGLDQDKRVDLAMALRSMINDIAKSATETRLKPEGLVVELRFSFEEDGDRGLRPVVFLGEQPPDYEVHRLRVTLGTHPAQAAEAAAGRATPPPRTPPPASLTDTPRKGPRIVVPSNPVLKLRKASSKEDDNNRPSYPADERPVPRAEVDLDPGQLRPVVEQSAGDTDRLGDLGERVVVFDHQRYHAKRRTFASRDADEFPDDEQLEETTDIHEFPIEGLDD